VLFVTVSDTDHSLDALVNLFYTQTLQTLISKADQRSDGQLKVPVRIIMDDFASSATIPDFDKIISVVRSRDIWLTMCVQSFTQLESLYPHAQALTLINKCDPLVYLGSNDIQSAEFMGTRALKTPEIILGMDRTKEYIIEGGKPAILVDKVPSYSYKETEVSIG
jgi:type IV secretory pathway TraG/TraD family ATPase VirD4